MAETVQHQDERMLQQWARVADCRRHTADPDVDAEWARFKSKHIETTEKPHEVKHVRLKLWLSAISGAAAMLIGILLLPYIYHQFFTNEADLGLVVMRHDESPQLVTMKLGTRMIDMSGMDSLNLRDNEIILEAPSAVTHAQHASQTEKSGQMQRLSTPRGMDFKLTLQDGTEVWLNAESTIEFPTSFVSDNTRRIIMTGEAYFKVARDESKPFVVNVGDKEVRVLGTEFDIRNYEKEPTMVALVKGSIALCSDGVCHMLKPGEGATWRNNNEAKVQEIDTYTVTQWVDGLFYFDEQPLDEILIDVARWYNVGIRFVNRQHSKYKIHFSASRTDTLDQLLEDLQVVCGYKITLEGKDIVVY